MYSSSVRLLCGAAWHVAGRTTRNDRPANKPARHNRTTDVRLLRGAATHMAGRTTRNDRVRKTIAK